MNQTGHCIQFFNVKVKTMLTKWETLFVLVMTLPIMGHVVILPLLLDIAGRDAWLSIIIALPIGFVLAYFIFHIRKTFPEKNFNEWLTLLLGKWVAKIVVVILIIYFLFLTVVSYSSLINLIYIGFLSDTPRWALALWFLIFFVYAALKGVKRIALTAGILTFIGMVTGHTVTLMDAVKKEWGYLLPVLEFGWTPVILGTLLLTNIWIELFLLLIIPIKHTETKKCFWYWGAGVFLNALMMFSTTSGAITIFGLGQAENFLYPAFSITRIINLGFIDRFDIYSLILMVIGAYVRCSLYLRLSYDLSTQSYHAQWFKKLIFSFFTLSVFVATIYIGKDFFRYEGLVKIYGYSFLLLPILFLLLIRARKVVP